MTEKPAGSGTNNLPLPISVSPEARRFLATGGFRSGFPPMPEGCDAGLWRAWVAACDKAIFDSLPSPSIPAGIQLEDDCLAGVKIYRATPTALDFTARHRVYLYFHGGGLILGGGARCRIEAALIADAMGAVVVSVDYRMPPDNPYPAALDDAIAVYRSLLKAHKPGEIAIGGASAGGNLAAALILRAQAEGLAIPAAALLLSPEIDLTESGDSFALLGEADINIARGGLGPISRLYANGHDLAHPYLSPLFGDVAAGFPPTLLTAGTRDVFLSNTVRMQRKLVAARIFTELHIFEAMPHGGFAGAPEDIDAVQTARRFLHEQWRRNT